MTTSHMLLVWCVFAGAASGQEFPGMPRKLTPPAPATEFPGMPKKTPALPLDPEYASGRVPPAALLDVAGSLIGALVDRPVTKHEQVRDHVLDADVYGASKTCARVVARIQPDCERAFLAIALEGCSHMDTIGYNDPVKAYTRTVLSFHVHQPVSIDDKGVHIYSVLARANAQVALLGVTDMRDQADSIVVGPGRYQFSEDQRQIEAITARKGERKLSANFTKELRPELEKVSRGLNTALGVLGGLGVPLRPMRWCTTFTHLHGEAGVVAQAPYTAPPALPASDITLRVHQSVLNGMAQKSLAGKTVSPLDLLKLQEGIVKTLGTPKGGEGSIDLEKVGPLLKYFVMSITFSQTAPLEVDLDAAGFTITLHGQSFLQGTTTYPARSIRGRYRIEFTAGGDGVFVRDGSVQIFDRTRPGEPDLDDGKEKAMRAAMENAFNLFLPARLVLPRVTIPGERPMEIVPNQAATTPGWLTLGWTRAERK